MPRTSDIVAAGAGGWSDDAVERLKALWTQEELTAAVIARRLGVSRNAVLGKVHRLQLPTRRAALRPSRPTLPPKPKWVRPARAPHAPTMTRQLVAVTPGWTGLVRRLELLPRQACHWPIGDPQAADFAFCGRPAGERIYCDAHWRLGHASRPRV